MQYTTAIKRQIYSYQECLFSNFLVLNCIFSGGFISSNRPSLLRSSQEKLCPITILFFTSFKCNLKIIFISINISFPFQGFWFLTASSPTQSKELLRHYQQQITFCKTFTQFKAYYVMSDMNWYDCIKSHHKSLEPVKKCLRMEKKEYKKGKEKENQKKSIG